MTTFVNNDVASGNIIYAADHNEQGSRLAAVLNGGIDNSNINASAAIDGSKLADASITNNKLSTATGQPGASWTSYTPVWTAFAGTPSIGNGTLTGSYNRIGKTIFVQVNLKMGSTTTFGTDIWFFSLPVTAVSGKLFIGNAWGIDTGTLYYIGAVRNGGLLASPFTDKVTIVSHGGGTDWRFNIPFTWGNGDELSFSFVYEAA